MPKQAAATIPEVQAPTGLSDDERIVLKVLAKAFRDPTVEVDEPDPLATKTETETDAANEFLQIRAELRTVFEKAER